VVFMPFSFCPALVGAAGVSRGADKGGQEKAGSSSSFAQGGEGSSSSIDRGARAHAPSRCEARSSVVIRRLHRPSLAPLWPNRAG
jgi:hypothetical protein